MNMIFGMKMRHFWAIFKHKKEGQLQRTLNLKSNPSCNATNHRGKDQKINDLFLFNHKSAHKWAL